MKYDITEEFAGNGALIKVRCKTCREQINEIVTTKNRILIETTEHNIMKEHDKKHLKKVKNV